MKPDTHHASLVCHNCQAVTSGNFCYNCGQETALHPASAREFLHEFIGHYVALEGKLWGTLLRLLFRPGLLTLEYIRGRRVRFLQPLRLYLTLSVLFFALLKFTGSINLPVGEPDAAPASGQQAAHAADDENIHIRLGEKIDGWLARVPLVQHQLQAFNHLPGAQQSRILSEGVAHYAPLALFCMMPVFALLLKILYLGSGRRFGEHLLFALHANAFAFIMLGLIVVVDAALPRFALWLWLLGYLPWAMQRVYQRGRVGTAVRWLALMALYVLALLVGLVLAGATGIVTAH